MPSASSRSSSIVPIRSIAVDSPGPKVTVLGGVAERNVPVALTRTVTRSRPLRFTDRTRSKRTSSPSAAESEPVEMLTTGRSSSLITPVASSRTNVAPQGLDSTTVKVWVLVQTGKRIGDNGLWRIGKLNGILYLPDVGSMTTSFSSAFAGIFASN